MPHHVRRLDFADATAIGEVLSVSQPVPSVAESDQLREGPSVRDDVASAPQDVFQSIPVPLRVSGGSAERSYERLPALALVEAPAGVRLQSCLGRGERRKDVPLIHVQRDLVQMCDGFGSRHAAKGGHGRQLLVFEALQCGECVSAGAMSSQHLIRRLSNHPMPRRSVIACSKVDSVRGTSSELCRMHQSPCTCVRGVVNAP